MNSNKLQHPNCNVSNMFNCNLTLAVFIILHKMNLRLVCESIFSSQWNYSSKLNKALMHWIWFKITCEYVWWVNTFACAARPSQSFDCLNEKIADYYWLFVPFATSKNVKLHLPHSQHSTGFTRPVRYFALKHREAVIHKTCSSIQTHIAILNAYVILN